MVKLAIAALFLTFGGLKANDIVCPQTRIYVSIDKEVRQVQPRSENMPKVLEVIKHIFKSDPRCKCVLKVLLFPDGNLSYQCLAKRPS